MMGNNRTTTGCIRNSRMNTAVAPRDMIPTATVLLNVEAGHVPVATEGGTRSRHTITSRKTRRAGAG